MQARFCFFERADYDSVSKAKAVLPVCSSAYDQKNTRGRKCQRETTPTFLLKVQPRTVYVLLGFTK